MSTVQEVKEAIRKAEDDIKARLQQIEEEHDVSVQSIYMQNARSADGTSKVVNVEVEVSI